MELIGSVIRNRYEIVEKIGEGGMGTVWMAEDMTDRKTVAIKVFKKDTVSTRIEDMIRYKNQVAAVSKLSIPEIVKIYEIGDTEDMYYVVMEYINGHTLQAALEKGITFDTSQILQIIYETCRVLKQIHKSDIIHGDLKPGNIILESDNKILNDTYEEISIKLIDLGAIQIKEYNSKTSEIEMIGTLAYMAPEQSGVTHKRIDERSDLYALGIIFYQLVTGELPFTAGSINSIIHQQAAKVPNDPLKLNPNTDQILAKMILKLLEKEPEKRYQTTDGLMADIEKYRDGQRNYGLGLDDKKPKISFTPSFTGREEEMERLNRALKDAVEGRGSICLVTGETGRGKTRILDELKNYVNKVGCYIDCKCFLESQGIAYSAFKDALTTYVKGFNKHSEQTKNKVRRLISDRIGELGKVVADLNPDAQKILGECPPLVELDPDRDNKRFLMVLTEFFFAISQFEGVLVLGFDDMQWMDSGSLEILTEMAKEISSTNLLIVGTFRNDELEANKNLVFFLNSSEVIDCNPTQIYLRSFNQEKLNQLINSVLVDGIASDKELSAFIFKKSNGNLFFAIEILKQLVNEKVLHKRGDKWHVNKKMLEGVEIPATVVDALIKKLSSIDDNLALVLSYASVIGMKFKLNLLFELCDLEAETVVACIDFALSLQLLEEVPERNRELMFAHSRIRDLFYQRIETEKRKNLHLKIAELIEKFERDTRGSTDFAVFDLAYHYIEGGNREKMLEYTLPAGMKAKKNYANEEALKYLNLAAKLIAEKSKGVDPMWITCVNTIGEIHLLLGEFDEAIEAYQRLLALIDNPDSKAKVFKQISKAYFKKGDWVNCEYYSLQGLRMLGELLPSSKLMVMASIAKETIYKFLRKTFDDTDKPKERKNQEKYKLVIEFYHILSWLYMLNDSTKCYNATMRMLNIAETMLGKSKELALSTGVYASFVLSEKAKFEMAIKYHQKAMELKTELNDEWGVAQSLQLIGFCLEWSGKYEQSIEVHNKSLQMFKKIGDLSEYAMSKNGLAFDYFYLARYDEAISMNDEYLDIASKSKDIYGVVHSWEKLLQCYIEKGDFNSAGKYVRKAYKLSHELVGEVKNWLDYCISSALMGVLYLERRYIKKSIEYLEKARGIYEKNNFVKQYTVFIYHNLADAYIYDFINEKDRLTRRERMALLGKIKKYCKISLSKTKHWPTHYGGALRVNAKYYALIKDNYTSDRLFLESMDVCEKIGRKYEYAKGLFEYGIFLEYTEKIDESRKYLELAYNTFKEIGSKVYEGRVAEALGIVEDGQSSTERFSRELRYSQRLSSIITLSRDISSVLDLDELLRRIMTVAIQITGAKSGYLMIKDDRTNEIKTWAMEDLAGGENEQDEFSRNIVGQVFQTGQTVLTTNAMEDERFYNFHSIFINELKSIICVPIKYSNEIKGVCYLSNSLSSGIFTEESLDVLTAIMAQAAISLENATLYRRAVTDGLTELYTHMHFKYLLQKEIDAAEKGDKEFALLMFDIDHFKKFNDVYGHQAGDLILSSLSGVMKEVLRTEDIAARYGGEEFAVILNETDESAAMVVAGRLKNAINSKVVDYQGQHLSVTVSMGISVYPMHATDADMLIKLSDEAMYISKQNGRNMITVYGK